MGVAKRTHIFSQSFLAVQLSIFLDLFNASVVGKKSNISYSPNGGFKSFLGDQESFFPNQKKCEQFTQGGPPTSYKYGYKSTYRGYRPFIGAITPFITSRGPPCKM